MRRLVPVVLTSVLVVAACSGDDEPAATSTNAVTTVEATTTTMSVTAAAQAYTEPGPLPVGVTTLELDGGIPVEVWYPAVDGTTGEQSYDMRDKVPEAVKDLLTANVPAVYTYEAGRDADVADGIFPLVLFSHGFSGVREQSTFLTANLASWGMIVAAPDHWSRDLFHVLDGVLGGTPVDANDSVDDLRFTRDLIANENARSHSRFSGHVDTERVAAVGHSAGGGSVLGIAADDGMLGYVSLASGARLGAGDDGSTTIALVELPNVPSLFVAGKADRVVPWDEATKPAFDAAPAPSRLWLLD